MAFKIAVLKETEQDEQRVALSADAVKKLTDMGLSVSVQTKAGENAAITDDHFQNAGAKIEKDAAATLKSANIIAKLQPPSENELKNYPKGALLIALVNPHNNKDLIQKLADAGIDAFAMDLVPRITRAQSMDALSSQANLAGYKAVLDATEHFTSALPMMMTAAGTVPPARVFVMGAGVAGLQAIATARRLGAIVTATDVRPAAKEQVESLGADFVAVEDDEFKQAENEGGYAKEMSKAYQAKQAKLVEEHIAKQDIVITTAQIPGRAAPKLISDTMIKSMKPGSVIVDLAVESGGNCAGSKAGSVVTKHGVKIIGHRNVPSRLATNASNLYGRNVFNLLKLILDAEKIALNIDWDDEIIKSIALTKGGKIIHKDFKPKSAAKSTPKKSAPKSSSKSASKSTSSAAKRASASKSTTSKKTAAKKTATSKTASKSTSAKSAKGG